MPSPTLPPLELSEAERCELRSLASRRSTAQALALRARIVLACAEGGQNKTVAAQLGLGPSDRRQVAPALRRASAGGPARRAPLRDAAHLGGCADRGGDRAHLGEPAAGRDPLEFARHGQGQRRVDLQRAARLARLRPAAARLETFKLSTDPDFVAKVRDVVGLYASRPSAPSCCASTRSARSRRWTAPSRCCPCGPARPRAAATTTSATAQPRCSPPWTSPPAR